MTAADGGKSPPENPDTQGGCYAGAGMKRRATRAFATLRRDVPGGITAGVVMLPIALGLGTVSGLGPLAGLYGAIAVACFAALFGGARGLISGPGMLTALAIAVVISEHGGSIAEAFTVMMLAGLIQIAFAALRFGRYVSYVPSSLLVGFYAAVGILLIALQTPLAVGAPAVSGNLAGIVPTLPAALARPNYHAVAVTAITLAVGAAWRGPLRRLAPAPLIMLAAGTLAGILWFRGAPVIGAIPRGAPDLHLPIVAPEFLLSAIQPAFSLALIAAVDALMMALLADTITGQRHRPNRELVGQGIGNIASGIVGGVPGEVSTPGTLANLNSGGRSAVAGVAAALAIASTLVGLGPVMGQIPHAALAAILITISGRAVDWHFLLRIHRMPRGYAFVAVLTALLVMFVDFGTAILVGLVMAALIGAQRSSSLELRRLISVPLLDRKILAVDEIPDDADPFTARAGLVSFPPRLTVASARETARIVGPDIKGHQTVIFDLTRTVYLDDTAALLIREFVNTVTSSGPTPGPGAGPDPSPGSVPDPGPGSRQVPRPGGCIIAGLSGNPADMLNALGALNRVPPENIVPDMHAASRRLRVILDAA